MTLAALALSSASFSRALRSSFSSRKIPTRLCHRLLQVAVDRVGVLAVRSKGAQHVLRRLLHVRLVDRGRGRRLRVGRGARAGALPEDDQVRERVPAEPVRAVHAAGDLARARTGPGPSFAPVSGSTRMPPIA